MATHAQPSRKDNKGFLADQIINRINARKGCVQTWTENPCQTVTRVTI